MDYSQLCEAVRGLVETGGPTRLNPKSLAIKWDHQLFRMRGLRIQIAGELVGHPIQSFKDLNQDEIYALGEVLLDAEAARTLRHRFDQQ